MNAPAAIPGFLRRLVYSYTNLHCYENICPYQMYRRYIVKDLPFVETPEMKWGNAVHSAFELRVGGNKPLPAEMQQWEHFATPFDGKPVKVELKVGITAEGRACDFFAKDVYVRGKIDLTMMQNTTAFINDYKTGNSRFEDPFELEIGAMMLHAANPALTRISGIYTWLKENRISKSYDLSNTRATWDKVGNIVGRIKADLQNDSFVKRPGGLCGWCDVLDCENNRKQK